MKLTPAPIGQAVPAAHDASAAAGVDVRGDDLPAAERTIVGGRRTFRATGRATVGGPGTAESFPDRANGGTAAHVDSGPELWRRAGEVAPDSYPQTVDALTPAAVQQLNVRPELDTASGKTPGDRNRAGYTSADPSRPARMPFWTFLRPFDKWISDRLAPDGVTRFESPSPLASTPYLSADGVAGAVPSPGGSAPIGVSAGIGEQPNSVRLLPEPWDTYAVNDGGPAAAAGVQDVGGAALAGRGRSFRA